MPPPLRPSEMQAHNGKVRDKRYDMANVRIDHCVAALLQFMEWNGDEFAGVPLDHFVPDTANDFRAKIEDMKAGNWLDEARGQLTFTAKLRAKLDAPLPLLTRI